MAMDVKKKLVELLNEVQETGVNEIPAGFGYTSEYVENEKVASHLIANGVMVQEWISVDDRLPEEKVNCIVHYKHAYCDNDGYWEIGICYYNGEKFKLNPAYKVTHWMPTPQPPKGE